MRAHSLRRTLWFANALLGAGVVGLAAWFFLVVRPATADPARLKVAFASEELEKYKRRPNAARVENAPVSNDEIKTIDRPEYQKLSYWIFSGPMPPEPAPDRGPVVEAPKPTGLETLGKPDHIIWMQADPGQPVAERSVVAWQFLDKKIGRFMPGEFIRQQGQPERFKLVDVRRPDPAVNVYEIVYDVHDDPKGAAVKSAVVLPHDARAKRSEKDPIRDVPPAGAAPAPGATAEKPVAEAPSVERGVVPGAPAPVAAADGPRPEPRFEEIRPEVRGRGTDRVEIDFDQATYDFVRGKSVESFAEKVKTTPAVDPKTGKPLGLRITGLDAQSPAQRFDVRPGDIVVSINGQPVRDRDEIIAIVQRMPQDTSRVTVGIDRNGRIITYTIDPRDPKTRREARGLVPK
jgi:hypothetical protein